MTIPAILSAQFSGIRYVHIVVQPSPPSISMTLFILKTEILYPLNSSHSILLSVSTILITPSNSYKWNCTVFVFLGLAYFTEHSNFFEL